MMLSRKQQMSLPLIKTPITFNGHPVYNGFPVLSGHCTLGMVSLLYFLEPASSADLESSIFGVDSHFSSQVSSEEKTQHLS